MKKRIAFLTLVVALTLTLSSCGNKVSVEELQAENESLLSEIVENEEKIASLEATVKSLNGEEVSIVGISEVEDGSGKKTFNSVGGKVMFDNVLEFTDATQAPNTSSVNLSERVSIIPSDNWVIQMNGTTTKYSHPNGIHGTVKVSTIKENKKSDIVDETMLQPFLDTVPNTGVIKSRIYVEDTPRGMMADITTLNNNKPAVIKCGLVGSNEIALVFTFYYDGDKDSTKDEIVNSLLKSIKFGSRQLRIE